MLSGYIDNEVEMPVNHSLRVTTDAEDMQSFDKIAGDMNSEGKENQIDEYDFEEKSSSFYDLDGESLW